MNKFRPILQGSPTRQERRLLSSSQLDVPPRNAKKRALTAFGVGSAVIATTQIAGVSTAGAAKAASVAATAATTGSGAVTATATATGTAAATTGFALALVKGLAIGAVAGSIAYGSLTVHREYKQTRSARIEHAGVRAFEPAHKQGASSASEPSTVDGRSGTTGTSPATDSLTNIGNAALGQGVQAKQPPRTPARQPSTTARQGGELGVQIARMAPDHEPSEQATKEVAGARSDAPKQPQATETQLSLRSERASIELAQAFVHRGNPAAALKTLTELQRQLPMPRLGPEALLVRIEALLKLGQLPEARRLGSQFLTSQPDGPYAQRVRSMLNLSVTR